MGLFFEVVVVGAVLWWAGPSVVQAWREFRARRADGEHATGSSDETGAHDKGVWVNPLRWQQIVTELENEIEPGENPRPGPG